MSSRAKPYTKEQHDASPEQSNASGTATETRSHPITTSQPSRSRHTPGYRSYDKGSVHGSSDGGEGATVPSTSRGRLLSQSNNGEKTEQKGENTSQVESPTAAEDGGEEAEQVNKGPSAGDESSELMSNEASRAQPANYQSTASNSSSQYSKSLDALHKTFK